MALVLRCCAGPCTNDKTVMTVPGPGNRPVGIKGLYKHLANSQTSGALFVDELCVLGMVEAVLLILGVLWSMVMPASARQDRKLRSISRVKTHMSIVMGEEVDGSINAMGTGSYLMLVVVDVCGSAVDAQEHKESDTGRRR